MCAKYGIFAKKRNVKSLVFYQIPLDPPVWSFLLLYYVDSPLSNQYSCHDKKRDADTVCIRCNLQYTVAFSRKELPEKRHQNLPFSWNRPNYVTMPFNVRHYCWCCWSFTPFQTESQIVFWRLPLTGGDKIGSEVTKWEASGEAVLLKTLTVENLQLLNCEWNIKLNFPSLN